MPVSIQCPACPHVLRLPEWYDGRQVECPACHTPFVADLSGPLDAVPAKPAPTQVRVALPPKPLPEPDEDDLRRPRYRRPMPRSAPTRPNPRRWSTRKTLLVVGLCLALPMAGIIYLIYAVNHTPAPFPDAPEDRRADLRVAFVDSDRPDIGADGREMKALFEGLTSAHKNRSQAEFRELIDGDRFSDEVLATGIVPRPNFLDKFAARNGLPDGISESLVPRANEGLWQLFEIRRVRKLSSNAAVVVVLHRTGNDSVKMRWWVSRDNGKWKVFDYEDVYYGYRRSMLSALLLAEELTGQNASFRGLEEIEGAFNKTEANKFDVAEAHITNAGLFPLPPLIDSMRYSVTGLLRFKQDRAAEAIVALKRALDMNPNNTFALQWLGVAHNRLGQYAEAIQDLQAYYDTIGGDSVTCQHLASAHLNSGRPDVAARFYREALDHEPGSVDAFRGLLSALQPADSRDELGQRFIRLDKKREVFDELARSCSLRRDYPALEQIALAMRQVEPDYTPAELQLARARMHLGNADKAAESIKAALDREKDAKKRRELLRSFLADTAVGGHVFEAYGLAPDKDEAFALLAAEAKQHLGRDDLRTLIDLHAKVRPNDPLLPFCRGEVHVMDAEYESAAKQFAIGMKKPPGPDALADFRAGRVTTAYHTGQALTALESIGPRGETLRQLTDLALRDEEYPLLAKLLDAQAKVAADGPELARARCLLKIRLDQTAEAIALFKSAVKLQQPDGVHHDFTDEFLDEMRRAGKAIEAYQAAPDAREAFTTLARGLRDDGRPDLRKLIDLHRVRHADDPYLLYYDGLTHLDNKAWDKGFVALSEAMKKAPADEQPMFQAAYLFAAVQAHRVLNAYELSKDKTAAFSTLSSYLLDEKRGEELDALINAHRKTGETVNLLVAETRAKLMQKKVDDALAVFGRACTLAGKQPQYGYMLAALVAELESAGRGGEAYRLAPDKALAFDRLAEKSVSEKNTKRLQDLLDDVDVLHRNESPALYFVGQLHLLRGEKERAAQSFTDAVRGVKPDEAWRYRRALYEVRVQLGQAADAYGEAKDDPSAFTLLADRCVAEKKPDQLAALIAAHRAAKPDDRTLLARELDLLWLKGDHAELVKTIDEKHEQCRHFAVRYKADDYRARSMVKLKRYDAAERAAIEAARRSPSDPLLVLVRATRGDVSGAIAAVERRPTRALIERCYEDAELGPLLKGEKFKPFRDRFPDPVQDKTPRFEWDD